MFERKKKTTKKVEEKKAEPKKPKKTNPFSPGTAKYQEWEGTNRS